MKKTFILFSTLFFIFLPLFVLAEDSLKKNMDGLQQEMDSALDWQADFTQKAYIASIGQYDTSSGIVKIKKPGKVLWEYIAPERQMLVTDGKKLYFYTEEERQVIVNDLDPDNPSGTNLLFLAGEKKIEELFHVDLKGGKPDPKDVIEFKMTPKTEQPNLSYLVLAVDKKTFRILSLHSFDPYENHTFVEFSNIRKNSKLPDNIFHFRIPEGTEVINASEVMK